MRNRLVLIMTVACLFLGNRASLADEAREVGFGQRQDQWLYSKVPMLMDEAVNQRIADIGRKIVAATDIRPDLTFRFRILNDPYMNAWATSGGFVYITTGLLNHLSSPDQLAAIMAHELVHIKDSHQLKKYDSAKRKMSSVNIFASFLGGAAGAYASESPTSVSLEEFSRVFERFGRIVGYTIALVSIRGYGRRLELQADRNAIILLQKAGYDPYALIRALKTVYTACVNQGIDMEHYPSALINAEPGLEERLQHAEELLAALSASPQGRARGESR